MESSLLSIQDLLRHRSDTGLEALELGPLIGRGSFGRVYKGAIIIHWHALLLQPLSHTCNIPGTRSKFPCFSDFCSALLNGVSREVAGWDGGSEDNKPRQACRQQF